MAMYWNKKVECMSREEMRRLQSDRLVKMVEHVYNDSTYYRKRMDECGVKPQDIRSIDDISKLPLLQSRI